MPLLHSMDRQLKTSTTPKAKKSRADVDRTLKSFDLVKELLEALREGDARLASQVAEAARKRSKRTTGRGGG